MLLLWDKRVCWLALFVEVILPLQLRASLIRRCDTLLSEIILRTFVVLEKRGEYEARRVREEERCVCALILCCASLRIAMICLFPFLFSVIRRHFTECRASFELMYARLLLVNKLSLRLAHMIHMLLAGCLACI